jgi:hypothetical protein
MMFEKVNLMESVFEIFVSLAVWLMLGKGWVFFQANALGPFNVLIHT